ncbi:MAG: transglutaminase-like cysteine peptidase [Xanthobacteraceae bacterium]
MVAATTFVSQANAEFYGLPRVLKNHMARLMFNAPSLAPMAYTVFCVRNPGDCRAPRFVFRPHGVTLTPERYDDLVGVNREVNRSIVARAETGTETWRVAPSAGNCHDFAVTKRHELLARGWPSKALVLAEVVTASGEHHLVLVARTHDGDLVLDNLSATVRPMALTRYQWLRAQSPKNPNFWSTVQIAAT